MQRRRSTLLPPPPLTPLVPLHPLPPLLPLQLAPIPSPPCQPTAHCSQHPSSMDPCCQRPSALLQQPLPPLTQQPRSSLTLREERATSVLTDTCRGYCWRRRALHSWWPVQQRGRLKPEGLPGPPLCRRGRHNSSMSSRGSSGRAGLFMAVAVAVAVGVTPQQLPAPLLHLPPLLPLSAPVTTSSLAWGQPALPSPSAQSTLPSLMMVLPTAPCPPSAALAS